VVRGKMNSMYVKEKWLKGSVRPGCAREQTQEISVSFFESYLTPPVDVLWRIDPPGEGDWYVYRSPERPGIVRISPADETSIIWQGGSISIGFPSPLGWDGYLTAHIYPHSLQSVQGSIIPLHYIEEKIREAYVEKSLAIIDYLVEPGNETLVQEVVRKYHTDLLLKEEEVD